MLTRPIRIRHPHTDSVYIEVVRPIPREGDFWGVLAPLKGTPWGVFPVVSGETFAGALHGHTIDLFRVLGPEPKYRLGSLPKDLCGNFKACALADKKLCWPQAKVPDCYESPARPPIREALGYLIAAWKLGYYVVVVEGDEFVYSRTEGLQKVNDV